MKFVISSTELLKGLLDVAKAIPTKTALPILENFLFVLNDNELEVTASDQELTLKTVIPVDSAPETGSVAVPARHITDLLKELPDLPLTIATHKDSTIVCSWATGTSSLPYFPAEDYPAIQTAGENALKVEFPAEGLVDGIAGTIYATADDEIRPAMNGIFFDIEPETTTLVASDSHKLICYSVSGVKAAEKASFILNKRTAAVLRSVVSKEDENVEVLFDNNTAVFRFGRTLVVCRLVVGTYPKYRSVIPQDNANILRIDRQVFLSAVKRVSVCANKASNQIKLDLQAGKLEISAQDVGFSIAAKETVSCQYDGDSLAIGFKSTFLAEILNNIGSEEVVVKFKDARRAALFLPADEEPGHEKVCGILMPLMITG